MKYYFCIAIVFVSFFGYSQSHTKNDFTISAIGGLTSGNVTDKFDCNDCDANESRLDYKFSSGTYGLNFQYGVSDAISIGLNVSYGSYLLTRKTLQISDFDNLDSILGLVQTMELYSGSIQAYYYLYNETEYNIFIGPSLGFTAASDKFAGFDLSTKRSLKANGLNYGLKAGINYFISENIGVILNASYEASVLTGDYNEQGLQNGLKRNISGFNILTGLIIRL